jgi:isopenicillin-N epimerase
MTLSAGSTNTAIASPDAGSPADGASHWGLDPSITFLNHGSCGACPRPVLVAQQAWRDAMEAEPIDFLGRQLPVLMDRTRAALAAFLGADGDDLVFVPNATAGISTVLRSVRFRPGDELLATSLEYNASLNALRYAAERDDARIVIANVALPVLNPDAVVAGVLACVTPRTKLALISHITSPTGVILPIAELVREMDRRGVDTLVDGAHGPGMVPIHLDALGAAYYTGNGHKWLSAPKGSGFLHVRRDRQSAIRPLAIGHGANDPRTDRSRFRLEHDVMATQDPTPYLGMGAAITFMGSLLPGGWPALMDANHALALEARDVLRDALDVEPLVIDDMVGSLVAVPLWRPGWAPPHGTGAVIHERLFHEHRIEVPIYEVPTPSTAGDGSAESITFVRISAQHYNSIEQYRRLAPILVALVRG